MIVKVTGIPGNQVNLNDFAIQVNEMFGNNPEIGTFRVRNGKNEGIIEVVFQTSFDAMEGQRLLHKNLFTCPQTKKSHVLRAKLIIEKDRSSSVNHSHFSTEDRLSPEVLYISHKQLTHKKEFKDHLNASCSSQRNLSYKSISEDRESTRKRNLSSDRSSNESPHRKRRSRVNKRDHKKYSRKRQSSDGSSDRSSSKSEPWDRMSRKPSWKTKSLHGDYSDTPREESTSKHHRSSKLKHHRGNREKQERDKEHKKKTSKLTETEQVSSLDKSISDDRESTRKRNLSGGSSDRSSNESPHRKQRSRVNKRDHKKHSRKRQSSDGSGDRSSCKSEPRDGMSREPSCKTKSLHGDYSDTLREESTSKHQRSSKLKHHRGNREKQERDKKHKKKTSKLTETEQVSSLDKSISDDRESTRKRNLSGGSSDRSLNESPHRKRRSRVNKSDHKKHSRKRQSSDGSSDRSSCKSKPWDGMSREPSCKTKSLHGDYSDTPREESTSKHLSSSKLKHHRGNREKQERDKKHEKKTSKLTETEQVSSLGSNISSLKTEIKKETVSHESDQKNKISELQKKLLNLGSDKYLHENEERLQEVVDRLMNYFQLDEIPNFKTLQDSDRSIIYDYIRNLVSSRLKELKLQSNLDMTYIIVDYKLKYNTKEDKMLINMLSKELVNLGQERVQSMSYEELGEAIDDVLQKVQFDMLMGEDIKPDLNSIKLEDTMTEEEDHPQTINITINIKKEHNTSSTPAGQENIELIKKVTKVIKKSKPQKFFLTIKQIIKDMKIVISNNANVVPCEIIVEKVIWALEKIIANLLSKEKGKEKLGASEVTKLFRKAYPFENDSEFVNNITQWIVDGAFDEADYLEKLLLLKQESHVILEDGEIISDEDEDDIKQDIEHIKKERDGHIKTEVQNENMAQDIIETVKIKTELPDITEDNYENMLEEFVEPVNVKPELPDISEEMATIDDVINSCADINNFDEPEKTEIKVERLNTENEGANENTGNADHVQHINVSSDNVPGIVAPNNIEQLPNMSEGESVDAIRSFLMDQC